MQSEKDKQEIPDGQREDWSIKDIVEQSANKSADETLRETLRGNESEGDADERDVAGSVDASETPQGREESKNNQ